MVGGVGWVGWLGVMYESEEDRYNGWEGIAGKGKKSKEDDWILNDWTARGLATPRILLSSPMGHQQQGESTTDDSVRQRDSQEAKGQYVNQSFVIRVDCREARMVVDTRPQKGIDFE